ncbi:AraC family transcriptional regulator [Selenomonas sp. oral taxon 149]|uniref:helix-turn-helix transcriptional regulator n=1 Tax=Selenomonas sp. oral taxon 149 TaxID=712535 RepID=UPI0001E097BC|nr:AraC family transcriptional regulator [Selenomonas sp. oral taxon 149]EFM22902.1 transcriptional regulator, AraC family [Selenomonas sp. oral taxon 149 str. 67H29BP]
MKPAGYNEFRTRGRFDFPIEFHHVDCCHPRFHMPYHWHIEYEIVYVLHGGLTLSLNEDTVQACAGDIIFIRDGIVHGGAPLDQETVYECIVFDMKKLLHGSQCTGERVSKILEHELLINKYIPGETHDVPQMIAALFTAMKGAREGYELIVTGMLYSFIGAVLQHGLCHAPNAALRESSRRRVMQLKKTFQLIDDAYDQPLTLGDLAAAAGLTPNYFCRFFQKITNRSPIDYLNHYRIEAACIRLARSGESITEIALATGFNDISYFIKTFRKYKGISPLKYQKANSA